jgi:ADP-heptose:LPS heptosyltransferase
MMKILVLRFSSIGDIVLTSPVVRCIKMQTGATVHFLTREPFRSLLSHNPYIDQVLSFRHKVKEVLPALKAEQYDLVIDLHHNLRSLAVKRALNCPAYSFRKLNLQKWLLVRTGLNLLPEVHIVDRYLVAAAPLGVVNDGLGLDYFLPPDDEQKALAFIHQNLPGPYIALVTGAAHATKRLPESRLTELCQLLPEPVVLLGGPEEADQGKRIAAAAGPHVVNACGQLSLHQSAALVKHARLVITHDTGLMHMAAAFDKKIISLWGNTVPEFGMYPYSPKGEKQNIILEVKGLSCRPCSKIGFGQCPRGHFRCMQDLPLSRIPELL